MKVISVIQTLAPGGSERSVVDLLPAIAARGVDVSVVQLEDRGGLRDLLVERQVPVSTLVSTSRRDRIAELSGILRREAPDLVHTQVFESDIVGRTAAALARRPAVSSIVNVMYGADHRAAPNMRLSRLRAAQAADVLTARYVRRFHAVSQTVAHTMARRLAVSRGKIDVIPRGRDPKDMGTWSADRRACVRADLGMDGDTPVVLAVGRHEWQKGLDVLLGCVTDLPPDRGGVILVAGREGAATAQLVDLSKAQGSLPWEVRLLGARSDVPDLMAAADVLAFPSRWEGLPGTLIEALALSLPVVASDIPQNREVIGGLGDVDFVPVDDAPALALALGRRLHTTAEVRSREPRNRFEARYDIARVAGDMHAFYQRALG